MSRSHIPRFEVDLDRDVMNVRFDHSEWHSWEANTDILFEHLKPTFERFLYLQATLDRVRQLDDAVHSLLIQMIQSQELVQNYEGLWGFRSLQLQ